MSKIKVSRSEVKKLLDSLPPDVTIVLKKDLVTCLSPDQILEQIDNKTKIGQEYYIQLALAVYRKKKNNTWNTNNDAEGIIL